MAVENVNVMEENLQFLSVLQCVQSFSGNETSEFTCSKNTQKNYKNDLHDSDNHDGVITHLEPDILECEVKGALDSITTTKARGGEGIPVGYFKS